VVSELVGVCGRVWFTRERKEKTKLKKIKFHIPGLNDLFPLNYLFINYLKQFPDRFEDGVEIGSVYGVFPPAIWNSGRVSRGNANPDYAKKVILEMDKFDIPIRWTFTNPLVKEEHLDDKFCNFCLQISNNPRNGVIIVSEILEDYIRRKYPNFGMISSTCKCIEDKNLLFAELEKDYKLVVLDYNFNTDNALLEEILQKDKVEILINAGCVPNCRYRKMHYEFHGEEQLTGKHKDWTLPCGYKNNPWDAAKYKTVVTKERLYGELVPMGYSNFKIEGRNNFFVRALEYYVYYMVKDEFKDRVRFEILNGLSNSRVLRFA
jgi:hypothetical protein